MEKEKETTSVQEKGKKDKEMKRCEIGLFAICELRVSAPCEVEG